MVIMKLKLEHFNMKFIRDDAFASIVVSVIGIPLCLGVALASKAPLESGIICAIIGSLVVPLFSSSAVTISGPAGALSVVAVISLGVLKSYDKFSMAIVLAGLLQLMMGYWKTTQLSNYFPQSVLKGSLASIGIILILKQIPHILGYDTAFMGEETFIQLDGHNSFSQILYAFKNMHWPSVCISLISFLCILRIKWGVITACIASIFLQKILKLGPQHLVQFPFEKGFKALFQSFHMPEWKFLMDFNVIIVGIKISIVATLESLICYDLTQKIDPLKRRIRKDTELFAQGIGNVLCGIFGALPMSAVFIRTGTNIQQGGRSKWSMIFHGIILLIVLGKFSHYLSLIPLSTIACILLVYGFRIIPWSEFLRLYHKGMPHFLPFIVTIAGMIFSDTITGLSLGLMVGVFFMIKTLMRKGIVFVQDESTFLIKFIRDISFLEKNNLLQLIDDIPNNSYVILDGQKGVFIDDEIVEVLKEFEQSCFLRNITLEIVYSKMALCSFFKKEETLLT